MSKNKRPPPDTVANILGRIYLLETAILQGVSMDVKEGVEKDKAMAQRMRGSNPVLKGLLRRMKTAQQESPTLLASSPKDVPAKILPERDEASEEEDDFLSKLDSL